VIIKQSNEAIKLVRNDIIFFPSPSLQATPDAKTKKNLQKHKPDEMKKPKAPLHLEVRQEQGADDQLFYTSLPLGKIDCASFCQTRCP